MKNIYPTKKFKEKLKKQGVILAYLYGSEARGEAIPESDVDIAVLLSNRVNEENYLKKTLNLSSLFNQLYPNKEIGLLILNQATPLLKQNVVIEGKDLYFKDKATRILFENKTLHEYEDTRHLRNIYNNSVNLKIKNL